jgi:hypothetical protein
VWDREQQMDTDEVGRGMWLGDKIVVWVRWCRGGIVSSE